MSLHSPTDTSQMTGENTTSCQKSGILVCMQTINEERLETVREDWG